MAASQARFLGLTARKTNTEFEGQQVNQQRTALANQSSGLFNQMLVLQVPIPPDSASFYNTQYSYSDASGAACKIMSYSPVSGGASNEYNLTIQKTVNETTFINAATIAGSDYTKEVNAGVTSYYVNINGTKIALAGPTAMTGYIDGNKDQTDNSMYSYSVKNGSATSTYYCKASDVEAPTPPAEVKNYTTQQISRTIPGTVPNAQMQIDANGKFSSMTSNGSTYAVSYEKVQDTTAYEAAMREYTINKDNYDKSISDINAQTEQIQVQDRTLELRLKQLDTEQNALQTEMDSVSKVIDKNIESTFKTFA